jgi:SAM-dependent methyltransferase
VAVDIAATALRQLVSRLPAPTKTGDVMPVRADLDSWPFAPGVFDLVLSTDFLDRRLFGAIKAALRMGGYALIDTFCGEDCATGPLCGDYRLGDGELRRLFADWTIVRSESPALGRDAILARKSRALTRRTRSATRSS